ncbi:MAG: NUDIX domain-containing protein, partial [Verrucomicrobia bacterium]|nr:NUDIX domain-containing protein [Verrucomicrobiota bacterium]
EKIFRKVFRENHHTVSLLPGAREILQYCHDHQLPTFLLSSVTQEDFLQQAKRLEVDRYFHKLYAGILDKREAIHSILADHRLRPDETLFVGDMEHDIETARYGKIRSCAVLTGYDSLAKLQRALPDHVAPDMFGVMEILRRHSAPEAIPPTPTVGALIVGPEKKLLMVHTLKWSGLWGIPGGKIKGGETAEEALRREILEETGLKLHEIGFALAQDCIRSKEFYKPAHFVLLNYVAHTKQTAVTLNPEADEYRWCTLDECYQLPLNTPTRILLDWYQTSKLNGR